jgi:hypothetical protein
MPAHRRRRALLEHEANRKRYHHDQNSDPKDSRQRLCEGVSDRELNRGREVRDGVDAGSAATADPVRRVAGAGVGEIVPESTIEDGAADTDTDSTANCPEEIHQGCGRPEVGEVDVALGSNHQDLYDHSETDPGHDHPQ